MYFSKSEHTELAFCPRRVFVTVSNSSWYNNRSSSRPKRTHRQFLRDQFQKVLTALSPQVQLPVRIQLASMSAPFRRNWKWTSPNEIRYSVGYMLIIKNYQVTARPFVLVSEVDHNCPWIQTPTLTSIRINILVQAVPTANTQIIHQRWRPRSPWSQAEVRLTHLYQRYSSINNIAFLHSS
jgi:hypothetical protein